MATPNKREILERAKEIWHNDRAKNGDPSFDVNPTIDELRECGAISQAMSELMRASGHEYKLYVQEDKAHCKTYLNHVIHDGKHPLDLRECKKSNVLISGTNQTGKSTSAMGLCDLLMRNQWAVLVFDNVGIWKEKSSIAKCFVVKEDSDKFIVNIGESVIFNIALLKPSQQRRLVEQILEQAWLFRVITKPNTWLMIVFEEFQLYARNVRGNVTENILRMMSVGANHKVRCLGITPDLALIDPAFIRLCQQRYHFRLGNEPNAKRRFRAYYGNDWCKIAQELDVGFCIYLNKEKLTVWKIPLFERKRIEVKA